MIVVLIMVVELLLFACLYLYVIVYYVCLYDNTGMTLFCIIIELLLLILLYNDDYSSNKIVNIEASVIDSIDSDVV